MYTRERTGWTKHIDFMILDILVLNIACAAAYFIRFQGSSLNSFLEFFKNYLVIFSVFTFCSSIILNNLSNVLKRGVFPELLSVAVLTLMSLALETLYLFIVHEGNVVSRIAIILGAALFAVLDFAARLLWKKNVTAVLKKRLQSKQYARSVYLVVSNENAAKTVETISSDYFNNLKISGITILNDGSDSGSFYGINKIASLNEAAQFICREWVDEVVVDSPNMTDELTEFTKECRIMGVTVHWVLNLQNTISEKQFIETLGDNTVVTTAYNYIVPRQAFIKRAADILGGIAGSILAVLIGIIIGPIIYISSPGPIIFKQLRIGKNGKQFYVLKFRSMYLDAEDRKKELMTKNRVSDGYMFKMKFDPRVIGNRILPDGTRKTGIGEFIRKTSLDEFPQFFNVLLGQMSLVGTRPPTVDEWEKYEFNHRARLCMRPGITGLWQVSGRSEITDFNEVVKLDTEYITKFRIMLDVKILLKTVKVLLQRKGAM